jgi:hypothetical protein
MENWKRYTLLLLTMFGLMMIVLTWQTLDYYILETKQQYAHLNYLLLNYALLMFGAFGLLFASTFMQPMNSKTKRTAFLTNPSSIFEKYLSRWLIMTVGYILAFIIVLWVVDLLRVGICTTLRQDPMPFINYNKLIYTGEEGDAARYTSRYIFGNKAIFGMVVSLYFILQSFFMLGSTFWEKGSFVKTFIAGVAISLAFYLLCYWSILFFYEHPDEFYNVLNSFEPSVPKQIQEKQAIMVVSAFLSFFTLANWVLTFFRLRESEIIKRI